jgi:hypothetical protein
VLDYYPDAEGILNEVEAARVDHSFAPDWVGTGNRKNNNLSGLGSVSSKNYPMRNRA